MFHYGGLAKQPSTQLTVKMICGLCHRTMWECYVGMTPVSRAPPSLASHLHSNKTSHAATLKISPNSLYTRLHLVDSYITEVPIQLVTFNLCHSHALFSLTLVELD